MFDIASTYDEGFSVYAYSGPTKNLRNAISELAHLRIRVTTAIQLTE